MPNVGRLNRYKTPVGNNIRVDDGYEEGMDIPIYYDPLISKLITYGKDRMQAIEMMIEAIDQYKIDGVQTTLPFGKFVMQHEAFRSGKFNTHFVKDHFSPEMLEQTRKQEASIASLLAFQLYQEDQKKLRTPAN